MSKFFSYTLFRFQIRLLRVKSLPLYFFILCLVAISSCEPENEQFTSDPNATLRFSTDSVVFDTVFTSIASINKRFLVYNDNDKALKISRIALRGGNTSDYELIINGQTSSLISDLQLLGKDSIQIIVSVTINPMDDDLPFLVTDFVDFETNGNNQTVNLVSWGQDAIFVPKSTLECDITWNANRPYVLLDSLLVPENCQWNIEKGVKIYASPSSTILIAGTINSKGTSDERVLFTNVRQDEEHLNAPGQWGGLVFAENSHDNRISFTDIRNAVNGIYLGSPDDDDVPDLILDHSKIENMSGIGIISFTSDLYAYNTLINNCGVHLAGHFAGGNYRYEHCTFANVLGVFFREDPSIVFSDFVEIGDVQLSGDINIELTNNIIWGTMSDEIVLSNAGGRVFEINATSNLIKSSDPGYENSNIVNEDPKFINPFGYNYELDTLSPAKDAGFDLGIATDLLGVDRDLKPDIGAFERVE